MESPQFAANLSLFDDLDMPGDGGLNLYDFQTFAKDEVLDGFVRGYLRQMLCLPTGAGKSVWAAYLLRSAYRRRKRAAFATDQIALVDQQSRVLTRFGIPHGVTQAERDGRGHRINVCSIPTAEQAYRGYGPLDLLILDEAQVKWTKTLDWATEQNIPLIGMSATPITSGLGKWYQRVVNVATTNQLVAMKRIAPIKPYAGVEIDVSDLTRRASGEWDDEDLGRRGQRIIGDVLSTWVRLTGQHFGGPVPTLVFTPTVSAGAEIVSAFQQAGYDFRQVSHLDADDHRRHLLSLFEAGEVAGLISCTALAKGYDAPWVKCVVDTTPNGGSLSAVLQKYGRGQRTHPGKDYCLAIDHAGNIHGWAEEIEDFWEQGVPELPSDQSVRDRRRREGSERQDIVCFDCGFVMMPGDGMCPSCGRARERRASGTVNVPGEIVAVNLHNRTELRLRWSPHREYVWRQMLAIARKRRPGDGAYAASFARAQYETLFKQWPERSWGFRPEAGEPNLEIQQIVDQQLRSYVRKKIRQGKR